MEDELLADIREATERSSALGDDWFIREMEARTGTRLRKGKPGPKPDAEPGAEARLEPGPARDELFL